MKKYILLFLSLSSAVSAQSFLDITNHPYEEAIESISEQEIVQGYGDGTFRPEGDINRAEFVKILLESQYPVKSSQRSGMNPYCFTDLKITIHWYSYYACLAKDLNIIDGFSDGSFRPDFRVNKAQAAKILYQIYFGEVTQTSTPWYNVYFNLLKAEGLSLEPFQGDPADNLTRGEMAFLIDSFDKKTNVEQESSSQIDVVDEIVEEVIEELIDPVVLDPEEIPKEEEENVSSGNIPVLSPPRVMVNVHPENEITGGYISNYDQWVRAAYPASLSNHILSDEEERGIATNVLVTVNNAREESRVSEFLFNSDLQALAQQFAEHLVINATYSHSDLLGQNPIERGQLIGYPGFVAESIVWRKRTPESAIDWWKGSAIHWNNISNPRFKNAGVGVAKEPTGGYIIVLLTGE